MTRLVFCLWIGEEEGNSGLSDGQASNDLDRWRMRRHGERIAWIRWDGDELTPSRCARTRVKIIQPTPAAISKRRMTRTMTPPVCILTNGRWGVLLLLRIVGLRITSESMDSRTMGQGARTLGFVWAFARLWRMTWCVGNIPVFFPSYELSVPVMFVVARWVV